MSKINRVIDALDSLPMYLLWIAQVIAVVIGITHLISSCVYWFQSDAMNSAISLGLSFGNFLLIKGISLLSTMGGASNPLETKQ